MSIDVEHTNESLLLQIVKEDGVFGLYRGLGANLLRTTPAAAITFLSYEASRTLITEWAEQSRRDSRQASEAASKN